MFSQDKEILPSEKRLCLFKSSKFSFQTTWKVQYKVFVVGNSLFEWQSNVSCTLCEANFMAYTTMHYQVAWDKIKLLL